MNSCPCILPDAAMAFGYCRCVRPSMCQPRPCPSDNLSLIQARITKFGPEVQNTLIKISVALGLIYMDLQGQI